LKVVALAVAVLLIATASPGEVRRIRLCADPSNLPFSAQDVREPGFEVEIGRAIADSLGADLDVHWYPTAREIVAFRQLAEGQCDLLMGLPLNAAFIEDKPRFLFSEPYYVMRQVLVSPSLAPARSLDDCRGKVIGVQAMTLSDQLVHERGHTRKIYRKTEETFEALARGDVDAAVMESALAGWFITKHAGFQGVVISDLARDVRIGAALRKTDPELKVAVDRSLERLRATKLPEILGRYGMTLVQAPVDAPALSPELRVGKSTYLTQCSQCHGPDAKGTPVAANLRTFKGSEADFVRVVQTGRPGTAMTPWKGLISEDDIRSILRYVKQLSTE